MGWPSGFPPWQEQDLQSLASQGQLSGINPLIIAGMEQDETGGWSGGAINSAGYGGYFGLGPNTSYPGGHSVTADQLNTGGASSPPSAATLASYSAQATTAAAEFASLLSQYGGDPLKAETAYQTGSFSGTYSQGASTVAQALGSSPPGSPNVTQAGPNTSDSSGATAGAATSNATKLTGLAGILQSINDLLNPQGPSFTQSIESLGTANIGTVLELVLSRAVFSIASILVIYIGFKQFTSVSAPTTIIETAQNQAKIGQAGERNELAQQRIDIQAQAERRRTVGAFGGASTGGASDELASALEKGALAL